MKWMKSPGCERLKREYHELKVLSRKYADKAHGEWWEAKAEEAERLYEAAMRLGQDGSLLKDLRLLRHGQKLKTDSMLFTQNDTHLHSTVDRVERWWEHFAQVGSISMEVVESTLGSVLEAAPVPPPDQDQSEALSAMPSEDEVRLAVGLMKNKRAPDVDDISAELLKLGGEGGAVAGEPGQDCVGGRGARGLGQKTHHPSA